MEIPLPIVLKYARKMGIAYGADYSMNETGETQTFYITGGCKDWNWNGEFESYSNDVNRSGAMIDCLNDGIITEENYFSSPSGELTMIQRLYEYGIGQEYTDPYGHHQLRTMTTRHLYLIQADGHLLKMLKKICGGTK